MQRNMIREATAFLLDVLKPNLPEHALLQTKVRSRLLHVVLLHKYLDIVRGLLTILASFNRLSWRSYVCLFYLFSFYRGQLLWTDIFWSLTRCWRLIWSHFQCGWCNFGKWHVQPLRSASHCPALWESWLVHARSPALHGVEWYQACCDQYSCNRTSGIILIHRWGF